MVVSAEISWKRQPARLKDLWETARGLFSTIAREQIHQLNSRVWDEHIFSHLLAVEKQRAKRSRCPFVLMLLDADQAFHDRQEILLRALPIVASSTRDTDLIGWKKQARVLGVIFTQFDWAQSNVIEKTLRRKVEEAFRDKLDDESAAQIAISTYILPDDNHDLDALGGVALQQVSQSAEESL